MAQDGEIIVNFVSLADNIQALSKLEQNLNNRKLNVSFNTAKGATADSLIAVAEQLQAIGQALGAVVMKTRLEANKARTGFSQADMHVQKEMVCLQ